MVTNDLGACEWFVWDLRRSGLIDRGQLDQLVGEFLKRNPRAEAPQLAEFLVQQGSLTAFQAERILNGKTQGLVLGPYILQDAIGQGSMGQVYKATSKNDTTHYAVKVLPRRSMWNVRLARRQVRSFSQFTHAGVVPFMDVGTAGGLHYLVWPLVDGQSLESVINQQGKLGVEQTALIGLHVAQGLSIAHQNNLFHGLVKPSNIMIGSDGQTRILDFGIGSLLVENEGESLVDTMSTANTLTSGLDCASPESILEPTNRTPAGDQYSLGCILYHCLAGRPPFPEGSAVEKMMAHQTKEPESIKEFSADVPDGFAEVISRLMAKKPEDRYGSCEEVVEALEPYLGGMSVAELSQAATSGSRGGTMGTGRSKHRMAGLGGNPVGNPTPPPMRGTAQAAPAYDAAPGWPSAPAPIPQPSPFPQPSAAGRGSMMGGFPATPAPAPVPQPATRGNMMTGFPAPPMARPTGGSQAGTRGSMPGFPPPQAIPQAMPSRGAMASMGGRGSMMGGMSGGMPDSEVPLTLAEPPPFADPNRQSIPGGWMPMEEQSGKSSFSTVLLIVAAMIFGGLAFFGMSLLMK
jgi:Protein kinase domain